MNYSFRFSNETNKNRLGRARNSFGLARPPTSNFGCTSYLCCILNGIFVCVETRRSSTKKQQ